MQTNPLESHAGLLRLFEAKARKRGASTESPQARNMNDTPDAINALLTTVKKMLSAYGWTQGCTEDEYVRSAGAERQLVISVIRNVVEGELRWFDLHLYRGVNDAVEHPPLAERSIHTAYEAEQLVCSATAAAVAGVLPRHL
jgi:hypothetical protein